MTVHRELINCLIFVCFIVVDSVPIDYIGNDQDPWQKMFVRQFFVPFYMTPEENKSFDQNNYYNQAIRNSYDTLDKQYGTLVLENHEVESLSSGKKGISDFGASYGFYPVGLAIFLNGVHHNLDNTNFEHSDIPIGNGNV